MVVKRKKHITLIKPFTPFERSRTKDINQLINVMGINPMEVTSVSSCGFSRYTTKDICNYFELKNVPFDATITYKRK